MPAKKELNREKAIAHLKTVYDQFLQEGGDPNRFTIRHYNRLNTNSHMYIDVYVKKLGGWNKSLQEAQIPLGFRQYKEFSRDEIAQYVNKVYQIAQKEINGSESDGFEKTFRMKDFQTYNTKAGNRFSLAVILKRFGSWSNVLRELNIPIGRSRGLTHDEITEHVKKIYDKFRDSEGDARVFSKEMYEKYNFIDDVYISSKLVERRFGTWLGAKKQMAIR